MAAVEQEALQVVVFSLGGEEYALPITQVQEVIRFAEPRAIASDVAWVRGVISLRGKIIPVCDLAVRLGSSLGSSLRAKIVIVEARAGTAGVVVDEVAEVLTIDGAHLDAVPAAGADFIEAIAKVDERLIVLLDPDRLLSGIDSMAAVAAAA